MECKYCDHEIELHFGEKTNAAMVKRQACFSCNFWLEKREVDDKRPWYGGLVINGRHYSTSNLGVNRSDPYPQWRGCGGRAYKITNLETGESVETNDLWHQGEIPDRFRHLFPDNATMESLDPPRPFYDNAFSDIAEYDANAGGES